MPKSTKSGTRANNGMGSIRLRSDGRWEGRYTSPTGDQKSVYGKTEKEAAKKLREQLHKIDVGLWREPSHMTVSDWSTIWLNNYQMHTAPSTTRIYDSIIRVHIVPIIGNIKLMHMTPTHVRRVLSDMANSGLSTAYIKQCLVLMTAMFGSALEAGALQANPAETVKAPRVVRKKLTIVDRDLFPQFIDACKTHRYGSAIIFLLLTGLRIGEERGLCWSNIDFDNASMYIDRQIPMVGKVAFVPPKDGSIRTIELPIEAIELLRQQKKELAALRLAAGDQWQDDETTKDLVFRSARGSVLNRTTIHKNVKSIGEQIGLPDLHAHDLRHSYAVAALRSGIEVKTVQNNLGHKNAAVTLDVYAAYTQDAGKVGAIKFSAYWQDAIKQK